MLVVNFNKQTNVKLFIEFLVKLQLIDYTTNSSTTTISNSFPSSIIVFSIIYFLLFFSCLVIFFLLSFTEPGIIPPRSLSIHHSFKKKFLITNKGRMFKYRFCMT